MEIYRNKPDITETASSQEYASTGLLLSPQGRGRVRGNPMPHASPKMIQRARPLRQPLTPAEAQLWRALRGRQANGLKFRRQHPIGPYVADFYCAQAQLVIEIDGPSHLRQEEYDQARTAWLESQGYRVVRYTNSEVQENIAAVLENIVERCQPTG